MMRISLAALAALLLAGCDDEPATSDQRTPIPATIPAPAPTPAPPASSGNATLPPPALVEAIPGAFQGRWGASTDRCGPADEMELDVTSGLLRFYESEGVVESVRVLAPDEIEVVARFTGEGENWTATHILALAENGDRLTVSGRGTTATRIRCP